MFATFVIMYRFGLSLNLMSLGGLALGDRHAGRRLDRGARDASSAQREEGDDAVRRPRARARGTVAMAVTASTLTTVAVFFPLVFVEGLAGQLIRDQALTISFSQLASLVVALTLVPMLAVLGARAAAATPPTAPEAASPSAAALGAAIGAGRARSSCWPCRGCSSRGVRPARDARSRRGSTACSRPFDALRRAGSARLSAGLRAGRSRHPRHGARRLGARLRRLGGDRRCCCRVNLFPSPPRASSASTCACPRARRSTSPTQALDAARRARCEKDPRVRFVYTSAGQTDLAAFAGSAREANRGQLTVVLKRADATARPRRRSPSGCARRWPHARPRLRVRAAGAAHVQEPGRGRGLRLRPRHAAHAVRPRSPRELAQRARASRTSRPRCGPGDPEVQIAFDRDRLAAMNLDPAQASRLVRNAVQGEAATQFSDLDRKLDVRVRASERERSQVAAAGQPRGRPQRGPAGAARRGRRRARSSAARARSGASASSARRVVSANLEGRDLGSAAQRHRGRARRASTLPPGRAGRARRPEPRDGRVVRLAALRAAARRVPRLPGDGEPVRVAAASVRDHVHDAAGGRRRGRSRWSLTGHVDQRDGADRRW